jgi:thiol-disulfide isomerase/thioredoxin
LSFSIHVACFDFQTNAQSVEIVKWDYIENLMNQKSDTLYVINFWATWCAPCVKELPYFDRLAAENKSAKLKVILISLDFKKQMESRIKPFVKDKNIQSQVVVLDEPNYNSWIDKVNPEWSGAIPATLIVGGNTTTPLFFEKEFIFTELNEIVKPLMN